MGKLEIEEENDEGLGYENKGEEYMSEEDRPKKHRAGRKSVNGFVKVSAAKGKELWRPGVKNH